MIDYKQVNTFFKKANKFIDEIYPDKINSKIFENNSFFVWKKSLFSNYLKPVKNTSVIDFDDIIGIDKIKKIVYRNTLQFIKGFPANNVLLWGEKGCGKSSLIKSLVKKLESSYLKLIEVKSNEYSSLESLFEVLVLFEDYKFIVFLDDISFNEQNENFKILKSILDGSLIENKNNFLIYATSNRRHMIKEKFRNNDEIHEFEAISEKISLSDRFGISLGLYKPEKSTYLEIARYYADKFNLYEFYNDTDALNWAMVKGGFSGRAAYQYAISLYGKKIN